MAPPTWATEEQWQWLSDRKGACADARRRGRLGNWLTSVFHEWFLRWPERTILFGPEATILTDDQQNELAIAISTRQDRITNWFNNHRSRTRESRGLPAAVTASLTKGKGRAPQAREIYCKMFYDDEKKAIVERDLKAERQAMGRKLNRSEIFRITRARVDSLFGSASDAERAQVEARLAEEKAKRSLPQPTDQNARTPQDYQNAIDAAPTLIERVLERIAEETGWCMSVVAAGPSPENGGEINSFAVHFGRNQSGHTLPQAIDNFRDSFIRPMMYFARGVYPREVRESRTLDVPATTEFENPSSSQPASSSAMSQPSSSSSTFEAPPSSSASSSSSGTSPAASSLASSSSGASSSSSSGASSSSSSGPALSSGAMEPLSSPESSSSPGAESSSYTAAYSSGASYASSVPTFPSNFNAFTSMSAQSPLDTAFGLPGSFNFPSGYDMNGNLTSFPNTWQLGGAMVDPLSGSYPFYSSAMPDLGMDWGNMRDYGLPNSTPVMGDPLAFTASSSTEPPAPASLPPSPTSTLASSPTSAFASTPSTPPLTPTSTLASSPTFNFPSTPSSVPAPTTPPMPSSPTPASETGSTMPDSTSPAPPVAPLSSLATLANVAAAAPPSPAQHPPSVRRKAASTSTSTAHASSSLSSRPHRVRKPPRRPDASPERPDSTSDKENDMPRPAKRSRTS